MDPLRVTIERVFVMKMKEAIDQFVEWKKLKNSLQSTRSYHSSLRHLGIYLDNPEIEQIDITQIMEYLQKLQDFGYEPNSFIPACVAFRKFFEFFKLQGYDVIEKELIPIPLRHTNLPMVADEESYQKILKVIPKRGKTHIRNRAIIELLWDTGARNGELLSMNVEDINLDRMCALIRTEKAKIVRTHRNVFWTKSTNKSLMKWLKLRERIIKGVNIKDPQAVFLTLKKNMASVGTKRMRPSGVDWTLQEYCKQAKIPTLRPHSFRHHRAHTILDRGGDVSDVANILGHASINSSRVYVMRGGKELEERYRLFQD